MRAVVAFAHARIPGSRKFGYWTRPTRFHQPDGLLFRDGPNEFRITTAFEVRFFTRSFFPPMAP